MSDIHVVPEVGDERAGFTVNADGSLGVTIRGWGFWSAEIANEFEPTVRNVCAGALSGCTVQMDMRELKPLRNEGQAAVGSVIAALPRLGVTKVVIDTNNQLTKLQLLRLVRERNSEGFVRFS